MGGGRVERGAVFFYIRSEKLVTGERGSTDVLGRCWDGVGTVLGRCWDGVGTVLGRCCLYVQPL